MLQADLAVHKKKIAEVESWIKIHTTSARKVGRTWFLSSLLSRQQQEKKNINAVEKLWKINVRLRNQNTILDNFCFEGKSLGFKNLKVEKFNKLVYGGLLCEIEEQKLLVLKCIKTHAMVPVYSVDIYFLSVLSNLVFNSCICQINQFVLTGPAES